MSLHSSRTLPLDSRTEPAGLANARAASRVHWLDSKRLSLYSIAALACYTIFIAVYLFRLNFRHPNAVLDCEITPEYLGVGYIIGPRIAAEMFSGGVLSWLVLIPLISLFVPEAQRITDLHALGFDDKWILAHGIPEQIGDQSGVIVSKSEDRRVANAVERIERMAEVGLPRIAPRRQ